MKRHRFLEDDFNFIPIVDNQVYNGSLVPWSEIASDVDEAAKAYEYSPAEFRNRVSMSLQRWASSGEDVLSAWLAVPAQLEAPIHCQFKICRRDNYSMTV